MGAKLASLSGYPWPVRKGLSLAPVDVEFTLGREVTIKRGASIEGRITAESGATIEPGVRMVGDATLGRSVRLGEGCQLRGNVEIGPWTNLVEDVELIGDVSIGGFCAIARRVTFQEQNHTTAKPAMQMRFYTECLNRSLPHETKGQIQVGNDVWVGADATILSGVTIGDGAIVGAKSVVTSDVDPFEIVAGVPAKHRGWRFDEATREALSETKWWNWSDDELREHREFFMTDAEESIFDLDAEQ